MDHGDIDKATTAAIAAKEAADARTRKAKIQVTLPDTTIITKEFEQVTHQLPSYKHTIIIS
jgi:hypothetical protein